MQTNNYDDPIDKETRESAMVIDVMKDGDRATCNLAVERILDSGIVVLIDVSTYTRYSVDFSERGILHGIDSLNDMPWLRISNIDGDGNDIVHVHCEQIEQLMIPYLRKENEKLDAEIAERRAEISPELRARLSRLVGGSR